MCTQAIPLSPSCDTRPHSDEFYFFHFFFLTHFDRAGPPAPASVTTSPQPQYHHTRIRMRCPSTLTRHLDIAATPLDLTDPLRLPPRPHHAAATRPHYDTSASVAHLDPHWRRLDTAPTVTSTPPATHSPCVDPTPSAPFQHHLSHDENALIDALYEVNDPSHPSYRAYLPKEQVTDLVAPHADTLELINSWLEHLSVPPSSVLRTLGG
ncbi:hypothetical protein EDB86DRAFT_3168205 [Lactarius hatsudake]|nr:hypothetical protein EDB86DRAFT_3168205 [Lactarius hatsudake]